MDHVTFPGSGLVRQEGSTVVGEFAQSSVEILTNSKGAVQVTVKVYAFNPEEASKLCQSIFDDLSAKYRVTAG